MIWLFNFQINFIDIRQCHRASSACTPFLTTGTLNSPAWPWRPCGGKPPKCSLNSPAPCVSSLEREGKWSKVAGALEFGSSANESLLRSLAFSNIGDWAQGCETITKSEIA